MLSLYHPEKYRVYLGGGAAIGLCSVWNEPKAIFNKSGIIEEKTAILGTLYSRFGVNIILRNLALNPQIKKVFIWGNGPLSNTQYGLAGKSVLKELWKNGRANFELEKEIEPAILKKIIKEVELIDASHLSFEELEKRLSQETLGDVAPYMGAVAFAEPVQKMIETFPSEEIGWLVRGRTILEAWSRVVERIMRYGAIKGSQYGYQQRELIGATWVVFEENPESPDLSLADDWPKELKNLTGATEKAIKEYHKIFLSPEPPSGVSYTYGNRLMRYPYESIDQIKEIIIKNLENSPDSRRAVATTMFPEKDKDSKEPPCITQIQCLQSGGKLHLLATVRSHDIFKAGIPNAFGLRILQKAISERLGFKLGQLQIASQSAHIYEQDWDNALNLARCLYWEREPVLNFKAEKRLDPRGNMIITTDGEEIIATLRDGQGGILIEFRGKSAKEAGLKIAELELLSKSDHLLDIGMELQKAEIALKKKIGYIQDRPLNF